MQHHPPDTERHFRTRKLLWRLRQNSPLRLLMMMFRRLARPAWYGGVALWLVGCIVPSSAPLPTLTPPPAPTPNSAAWQQLDEGLEQRIYRPRGGFFTQITALRIDPARYDFRTHYRPGEPLFAAGWREQLPSAAAIVNGNFFDSNNNITGILFSDGVAYGQPYQRRGGTFYIQDGRPAIQSNLVQPYNGEQFEQAVQAFPMLVTRGERSYFDTRPDRATRRTVIGIDAQGRVLILVTTFGGITLLDLTEFLVTSDLMLTDALNLDGGGSSMLDVMSSAGASAFISFDPVPAVLAVYRRDGL